VRRCWHAIPRSSIVAAAAAAQNIEYHTPRATATAAAAAVREQLTRNQPRPSSHTGGA